MSESDSSDDLTLIDIDKTALLPKRSKEKYQAVYNQFMEWKQAKNAKELSENLLLEYFKESAQKLKPSTLWSRYSMLKSTMNTNNNIDISTYKQLNAFLKKQSAGFISKKRKVLSQEAVIKFINEAPNYQYLVTKVALIFGIFGALRRRDLCKITTADIKDYGSHLIITVRNTKTQIPRKFLVDGSFYYRIFKKYEALRPRNAESNRFFLNYQHGKCTNQVIGINKFGKMPKQIAHYLKLPDADLYTGHSFPRPTSALHVDSGTSVTIVKRQGNKFPESTEFVEMNTVVKAEESEVEEVEANPLSPETDIKTENEDLINKSGTNWDDPLRVTYSSITAEEISLSSVDEVNQYPNSASVKIEKDIEIVKDADLENEKSKEKSQTQMRPIEDDVSNPETSNDSRSFERCEKPRSRSELKHALFVSEYEARKWKAKLFALQKRHTTLLQKVQNFENLVMHFKAKKLISYNVADKFLRVVPNTLKLKTTKSKFKTH